MIVLSDVIEIQATPRSAFDFLVNLHKHYVVWHPDHRSAVWTSGPPGEEGSVLNVEEVLHRKLHRLNLRVTKHVPDREIRYRVAVGVRGAFRMEPLPGGILFAAESEFGWTLPVVGPAVDMIARLCLRGRMAALHAHMAEEAANLKVLLESPSTEAPNFARSAP